MFLSQHITSTCPWFDLLQCYVKNMQSVHTASLHNVCAVLFIRAVPVNHDHAILCALNKHLPMGKYAPVKILLVFKANRLPTLF